MPVLDGAYGEDGAFFTAPAPSPEEVEQILARIVRRSLALLSQRDEDEPDQEDLPLARGYLDAAPQKGTAKHGPPRQEDLDFGC